MSINLNKVSVSLAEFQKISSGTHNAGEVTLKNEHSLDKVNHHVGALRGRNKVAIPHEQIVAVKKAFVGALGAGGVSNDELHMKPGISAIQLMNSLSFGGVTNDDILDALDKGGLAPMHAKALAEAVRDSGIAGLDGDRAVALFATANPAGRDLAEVIRSAPDGISPQELYSFAISVLRNHAGAIADRTAATKLFVPLDAREIAGEAYHKAGDDPARADRLVAAAFAACGTDADLRRIVRDNLDEILVGSSAALRSAASIRSPSGSACASASSTPGSAWPAAWTWRRTRSSPLTRRRSRPPTTTPTGSWRTSSPTPARSSRRRRSAPSAPSRRATAPPRRGSAPPCPKRWGRSRTPRRRDSPPTCAASSARSSTATWRATCAGSPGTGPRASSGTWRRG